MRTHRTPLRLGDLLLSFLATYSSFSYRTHAVSVLGTGRFAPLSSADATVPVTTRLLGEPDLDAQSTTCDSGAGVRVEDPLRSGAAFDALRRPEFALQGEGATPYVPRTRWCARYDLH